MPNWCSNTVTITGDSKHLDDIEKTKFDFNKIIPMPKELHNDGGGRSQDCPKCGNKFKKYGDKNYPDFKCSKCNISSNIGGRIHGFKHDDLSSLNPNEIEIAKKWIQKYGTASWYEWSCNNWGTKWNTGDVESSRESATVLNVYFTTAWGPPDPIFRRLTEMFNVVIKVRADIEMDTSGILEYKNGECIYEKEIDGNNNTMWLGGGPSRAELEESMK